MAPDASGDVGDGRRGNWGFPEGGMGAVADAIASAARGFGAEIRTGAPVARVLTSGGRAPGVALESGEGIGAGLAVTSLHPRTAVLDHVGRADPPGDFVARIEHLKHRTRRAKIKP